MEETCFFVYSVFRDVKHCTIQSNGVYSYSLGRFHLCCVIYTDLSTLLILFCVCLFCRPRDFLSAISFAVCAVAVD